MEHGAPALGCDTWAGVVVGGGCITGYIIPDQLKTRNTFNFIGKKNKNVRAQFRKSFMPLSRHFFKLMELLITFLLQIFFSLRQLHINF